MDLIDDALAQKISEEIKRRKLVINATCKFCNMKFISQDVDTILEHNTTCKGRLEN